MLACFDSQKLLIQTFTFEVNENRFREIQCYQFAQKKKLCALSSVFHSSGLDRLHASSFCKHIQKRSQAKNE